MVDQNKNLAHLELVTILKSNKGLKCGHINVNGLYHKIEEIRLLLTEAKIEVLAVSETHLNADITDKEIQIDNYTFVKKDRVGRGKQWGGILI